MVWKKRPYLIFCVQCPNGQGPSIHWSLDCVFLPSLVLGYNFMLIIVLIMTRFFPLYRAKLFIGRLGSQEISNFIPPWPWNPWVVVSLSGSFLCQAFLENVFLWKDKWQIRDERWHIRDNTSVESIHYVTTKTQPKPCLNLNCRWVWHKKGVSQQ